MPCDRGTAIGIDLGTTYSCVGVFQDGEVQIAANDQGNRSTPSYVAFTDVERLIGDPAEAQIALNPENTVFATKRLMGGQYEDSRIQAYIKHWPFRLVNDRGKPKIRVCYKGEVKHFNPEEISAMVLTKMKSIAETYVGHKVEHAVISVPAYFNDSQRQATMDAGKIAGLNVLRIINETTAAALAYGLDRNLRGERNVLVVDLGGGAFDVSVLTVAEGSLFEVKATAGNTHLGGEDFTNRLTSYFIEEFKQKHGKDVRSNKRALVRLRTACERAKRILSSCGEARVEIDALCDGVDFYTKITRPKFEELCIDLFRSILEPVERVLKDAKLEVSGVHDVVLVGGCTRIPKIQKLLRDFFSGKELCMSINPEEAVAYGAAVQAAVLAGDLSKNIKDVLLVDVAPLSVGIEAAGGIMTKVIERNSRIPCHTSHVITAYSDSQTEIEIHVYEGEWRMTKNNHLLGTFELRNLPLSAGGISQVELMFDVDANGILQVSAFEKGTDRPQGIKIIENKGRLSSKEIERMVAEAKRYEEEDQEQRDKVAARNSLESYVYSVKEVINCISDDSLSSDDKSEVKETCDAVVRWLDSNAVAERDEIEHKTKEVQSRLSQYMIKLHQNTKSSTVSSNGALFEEVA